MTANAYSFAHRRPCYLKRHVLVLLGVAGVLAVAAGGQPGAPQPASWQLLAQQRAPLPASHVALMQRQQLHHTPEFLALRETLRRTAAADAAPKLPAPARGQMHANAAVSLPPTSQAGGQQHRSMPQVLAHVVRALVLDEVDSLLNKVALIQDVQQDVNYNFRQATLSLAATPAQ